MDAIEARYTEVMVRPEQTDAARALNPLRERRVFGRSVMLFDNAPRERLQQLGELRTPSIADLFVATMEEPQARQEVIQ
jgi:ABC-2 type transport system ATP-binding protein